MSGQEIILPRDRESGTLSFISGEYEAAASAGLSSIENITPSMAINFCENIAQLCNTLADRWEKHQDEFQKLLGNLDDPEAKEAIAEITNRILDELQNNGTINLSRDLSPNESIALVKNLSKFGPDKLREIGQQFSSFASQIDSKFPSQPTLSIQDILSLDGSSRIFDYASLLKDTIIDIAPDAVNGIRYLSGEADPKLTHNNATLAPPAFT